MNIINQRYCKTSDGTKIDTTKMRQMRRYMDCVQKINNYSNMQSIYFSIHQRILHHFTIYKIQRTAMFISLHKQSNTVDEIFLFRLEHLIQGVPRNMKVGK